MFLAYLVNGTHSKATDSLIRTIFLIKIFNLQKKFCELKSILKIVNNYNHFLYVSDYYNILFSKHVNIYPININCHLFNIECQDTLGIVSRTH